MRFRIPSFMALALLVSGTAHAAQNPCNEWDTQFGASGPDAGFEDFATFDDGTGLALYAAGRFRAIGAQAIEGVARWNGTNWSPVGGGLRNATALAVFDDGSGPSLYAGGSFGIATGAPANTIARWNGTSWVPLSVAGPTGNSETVNDLEVFDDGSGPALYVAGRIVLGALPSKRVVRWNGTAWSDVNNGITMSNLANTLGVFDAGAGPQIYVGFTGAGQPASVLRWNGTIWTSVSTGIANAEVRALLPYRGAGGTSLYAAGRFPGPGGTYDYIQRFDGTTWSSVGGSLGGPIPFAQSLGVHDDGSGLRLYVGGAFTTAGGQPVNGIASWDGTTWQGSPPGLSGPASISVAALHSFDDGSGPGLFVGGTFSRSGRTAASNAAVLKHNTWSALATSAGTTGYVTTLDALDIGNGPALYASGYFDTIGTTVTGRIARWDGATWTSLGEALATDSHANALAVFDDGLGRQIYATGAFTRIGGVPALGLARWNGLQWSTIGALGGSGEALLEHDDGTGSALYVAGQFVMAGGVPASNIARWDGTSWSALGSGTNFTVKDLAEFDDGSGNALYACGIFSTAGGIPVERVARWQGQTWSAVGTSTLVDSGPMNDLAVYDDGSGPALYLVGFAMLAGATVEATVSRWNGSVWTAVATPPYSSVGRLEVFDDGSGPRLVGGFVNASVGSSVVFLRAFDGTQWTTLPGTIDGPAVTRLASFDAEHDGVPDLYIAGSFRNVAGQPASNLARFASCGTVGLIVCAGDGSGAACPCGNFGASGNGCANSSFASGASLRNGGLASLANDTLRLDASELTGSFAIFAQGTSVAGGTGVPFGDGLRCAGGTIVRLASAGIANGSASIPESGGAPLASVGFVTSPGTTRIYQAVYRNGTSFCMSSAANASNGLRVTWTL